MSEWKEPNVELPPDQTPVLAVGNRIGKLGDITTTAIFYRTSGWLNLWTGERMEVGWWMPMPELPKEEEPHEIKAYRLDEHFPDD